MIEQPFWQVGIVVPEIESAMAELSAALGVEWSGPRDREVDGIRIRVAFAMTPPPYLELLEGPPGSVWDATAGARIHHLGFWSADKERDGADLEGVGFERLPNSGYARYYLGPASGTVVELVGRDFDPRIDSDWGLPRS